MINGSSVFLQLPSGSSKTLNTILDGVSFEIPKGRITSFIGKSGAGKTSLLKCIANLISTYEGSITFQGKAIKTFTDKERVSHIGFVFQQFNLFPHMTALQNCAHPLKTVLNLTDQEANERAMHSIGLVSMTQYAQSYPSQLSGGQQQRIAIARALALNPEVLLFDEPTSALDPESTRDLQGVMRNLCAQGITIALSSHDMPFIKGIIDIVYFLEQGKIVDIFDAQKGALPPSGKIYEFLLHI